MMAALEIADTEVSNAFQQARIGAVFAGHNTTSTPATLQLQQNADRSEDEESDHTSDPYTSHMRGRVSPSPYTANTERARMFNAYVRGVIEQKLDVLVPISHQPRDLITDIIADASGKFPEFASCVRKRIRTFLKSYRRSRKLKDGTIPTSNGIGKMDDSEHSPTPEHTPTSSSPNTAVVTIITDTPQPPEDEVLPPEPKKARLSPPMPNPTNPIVNAGLVAAAAAAAASSNGANSTQRLSPQEVLAIKQLITGYRESAAFLERAADQLGLMLRKDAAASSS